MTDIITDTSITPITTADDVIPEVANTAHDELQAMMDEIQAHHNGALVHTGDLNVTGNLQENGVDVPTISSSHTLTNKELGIGTKIVLGSDADGDIYYRGAGILKRLPKGTDSQILELISGLPAWTSKIASTVTRGLAELATDAEVAAGTDTDRAVTPAGLAAKLPLLSKVIDIGDWDMTTATGSSSVNVAHGLTSANIRSILVSIRPDIGTNAHDFMSITGNETSDHRMQWSGTNVTLNRGTAGFFDDTLFDSTSFNRGWIIISYVP